MTYPIYFIKGYKFHASEHPARKIIVNKGVCVKSSNYSATSYDYYSHLTKIVQLEYPTFLMRRTIVFKCKWFDLIPNVGMKVHKDYYLVDINHKRRFNKMHLLF